MSVLVKAAELKRLCPTARADVLDGLARAAGPILAKYEINTSLRLQHFMAQIAHESAGFRYLREVWGPTPAQTRYEGRKDLGNTQPGDGFRFRGRGFLQVTGRANYRRIGAAMGLDLEAHPEKLEEPAVALESACIYWRDHRLNALADKDDLRAITLRVNGGLNGYDSRNGYLKDRSTFDCKSIDAVDA